MEEISAQNLKSVNIRELALKKEKFGAMTFDRSYPYLEQLRDSFIEFDDLGYEEQLIPDFVNRVNNLKGRFVDLLRRLASFNPAEDPNFSRNTRDTFETEVEHLYRDFFSDVHSWLSFLRQRAALKSKDQTKLQELQKLTQQAQQSSQKVLKELQAELEGIRKRNQAVETAHAEIATRISAKHFSDQANDHLEKASDWLTRREKLYRWLLGIIGANFVVYFFVFFGNRLGRFDLATEDIFTIEYGLVKLALISLLSYGLAFVSKNYRINCNLESVNRHRSNVANTVTDFLATNPEAEDRAVIVRQAVDSMFKHLPNGHEVNLGKDHESGPVSEVVQYFFKPGEK